jgi:hypothetical protein
LLYIYIGEKFRLCHFDDIGEEEDIDACKCLRFKLDSNKDTKFVDIGMLRMDGANERTVVFYPKGKCFIVVVFLNVAKCYDKYYYRWAIDPNTNDIQ